MEADYFSKLVDLADSLSYKRTGRHLKDVDKEILKQILLGKKYEDIELDKSKIRKPPSNGTIRKYRIPELWKHLSIVFRKPIEQKNILDELERLQLQKPKSRVPSWIRVFVSKRTKLANNTIVNGSSLGETKEIRCLNFEEDAAEQTQAEFHHYSYQVVKTDSPGSTNSTYGWHLYMRLMKPGLALLIALGAFGTWWGFYWLANWYGTKSHLAGNLPQAQSAYNWALKINPLNLWTAEAHYNLGGVYEDQQNYKQAQVEYQKAMELGLISAYNNQARLYILSGNYSAAVALLQVSIPLTKNEEPKDRYSYFKNLGWARLEQGRVEEAEVELEQAIALQGNRSAAYCLLAQVLERQGEKKQAVSHWEDCIAYTHLPRTPEEDKWIRLGQQKLKAAYGEIK